MQILSILFSLTVLAISLAHGLAIDERATTTTCNTANVDLVKSRITHHVYFCAWYISAPRTRSPFLQLGATDTFNACKCITQSATATSTQVGTATPTSSVCSTSDTNIVKNEYFNPTAFCSFYTSQYPSVTPESLQVLERRKRVCHGHDKESHTDNHDKELVDLEEDHHRGNDNRLIGELLGQETYAQDQRATSVGDFANGLKNWKLVTSANASGATSTGYDSDGSAALLTCKYAKRSDSRASLHSELLSLCIGSTYTVSFKYKWASSGSSYLDGVLTLYNFGRDQLLGSISGPTTSSGLDSNKVAAGTWGSYSATFTSLATADMILISLGCPAGGAASGQAARVTIDNVRVTKLS
ncbi:hypothetical protein MBLNU459_g5211t2 [Dothideomycetes sp. NU459]